MTNATASVARRWARVQAGSGLVFLAFATMHLVNTALATLGPSTYNGFQRALRPVYQFPLIEIGLILVPLVVHIVAGVARIRLRNSEGVPRSWRTRVHRYAGYFLMAVVVGHIIATRAPALLRGIYPEFEGVAFTFQFLPYFFDWYYPMLALTGLLHAAIGAPIACGVLGLKWPRALREGAGFWLPVSLAALLVTLGVASVAGVVYEVPDMSSHPFAVLIRGLVQR